MNISEIHVDDFGAWHNLTLEDLSKGATVFYGPNEAGKTTLLNIIRTVLYGYSEKRAKRYLPPAQGTRAGGSLLVSDVSGQYRVQRSAPANYRGGEGTLDIQSTQGTSRGNDLLTSMLAGVDETIFNNVFAVGLSQIQQLSTLSDTEAANQLYGLATGVDRVSIFDVTRKLEDQREEILPPASRERGMGRLEALLDQKSQLEKELKALRRDSGVFAKKRAEYRELTRKIADKKKSKRLLDKKGSWAERSGEIRKHWSRCRQINDRLSNVGPIPDIPRHIVGRVTGNLEQVKKLRTEWEQLSAERKRIKQKASKYQGRDTLYRHAAEIQALERQRARIVSIEEEVKRGQAGVEELEFELQAEMEAISLEAGTSANRLPPISDEIIEALRVPARETRELREAVESTKKMAETYSNEAKKVKAELDAAAVRFGGEDITLAMRKKVALVQSIEQRLGLDEHREDIVRQIDEIEEDTRYWASKSVLPWNGIMTVCAVFSAGVMFVLAGLLHGWFNSITIEHRPFMLMVGLGLSTVSLVIKNVLEGNAAERAEISRAQMLAIRQEQQEAELEAEELERNLKNSPSGTLDQRLIDARQELAELDLYVPLTQRFETLTREAEAAEHQSVEAVRQLKESRRGWKASLRAVGLPESLTPSQIGSMTGRVSDVTRIRNRVNESKRELKDREQELGTIRERIEQLLSIGEVYPVPEGLGAQLSRLVAELEKHSRSGKERESLKQRWDQLHDKQKRLSGSAQQLVQSRQQLLDAHGITGVRDFRNAQARGQKSAKMRRERDKRLQKIASLTEGEYSPKKLQAMLDNRSNRLLEKIKKLDREHKTIGSDLKSLEQRATELKSKIDGQMQDRRIDHKELALQCIEEKIRQTFGRWQRSALVSHVLDQVKLNYETKRQPVALAEASRHLERLTEGRYTRVWTPMGQESLCVDDSRKQALPVEKLSRGTRELVFLSLRLALVSSYNRRGANMPIVLDDVFVNFDDNRARAVAQVLADIANGGQQMLIFTCHERIRSIFHELGHDVRDLPVREGITTPKPQPLAKPVAAIPEPEPVVIEKPIVIEKPVVVERPIVIERPVVVEEVIDEVLLEDISLEPEPVERKVVDTFDQFTPAWRDEWMEPLPDIAE